MVLSAVKPMRGAGLPIESWAASNEEHQAVAWPQLLSRVEVSMLCQLASD